MTKKHFIDGLAQVGNTFYYRFSQSGDIKQGTIAASDKEDAKIKLLNIKIKAAREARILVNKDMPTFKEAVDLWYNSRKGKRSDVYLDNAKKQMELHIIPKIGHYKASLVTADVVEIVLNEYLHSNNVQYPNKKHSLGGYNTYASWISAVLGNLVPAFMEYAPKIKLEKQQKVKKPFIPKLKIGMFLAAVDKYKNLHVQVAVRAMLYMGLRESEALQMKWENLDETEKTYTPDKTKGKEAVSLPCPAEMLLWFKKVSPVKDCPWILPAEDELPHRKQFTKKTIVRAGVAIGVKLSPHRLRGTFATLLAKKGKNAYTIKDMLRHKDIKTSEGYIELGLEDMKAASDDLWNDTDLELNEALITSKLA